MGLRAAKSKRRYYRTRIYKCNYKPYSAQQEGLFLVVQSRPNNFAHKCKMTELDIAVLHPSNVAGVVFSTTHHFSYTCVVSAESLKNCIFAVKCMLMDDTKGRRNVIRLFFFYLHSTEGTDTQHRENLQPASQSE